MTITQTHITLSDQQIDMVALVPRDDGNTTFVVSYPGGTLQIVLNEEQIQDLSFFFKKELEKPPALPHIVHDNQDNVIRDLFDDNPRQG